MSRRIRWAVFVLAGILPAMLCSRSPAQQDVYQEDGVVTEAGPMGLLVTDTKNNRMFVQYDPSKVKVTVAGTAEPGYLKGGLLVRFEAKLDLKGNAKDDVAKLDLVAQSDNVYPRCEPDIDEPTDDLKELQKKGPVKYLIIGTLRSFKNGQLQVKTPDMDVKAKLADKPEIRVDVDDLGLVREGDKIEIKGKLLQAPVTSNNANLPGEVFADEIKVTLSKPLAGKKPGGKKVKKVAEKKSQKKSAAKKPKKKVKKRSADEGFGDGGSDF